MIDSISKEIESINDIKKIAIDPRNIAENALWAAVINYFRGLYNRFIASMKSINGLSPTFWDKENEILATSVAPHLTNIAQYGVMTAEKKLDTLHIAFDNTLVHADAAKWASQHSAELITNITETNKKLIQQSVANYIQTKGMTLKDLANSIKPALSGNDSRALMIARTETTRAFSEGNNLAYQKAGIPKMLMFAPLHINCRCGQRVVRVGNSYYVVWETDQDDLVCTRPIQTPLMGLVNGCKALNNVVISEGQWFGHKISEVKP